MGEKVRFWKTNFRLGCSFQNQAKQQKRAAAPRFSKNDHETLAEIFKKIGQKEQTQQGLQELYNLKQQVLHKVRRFEIEADCFHF